MIRSASMLFSNTACLMILFAPKVYHVLRKTPDSDQTEKTEAASKTQKSTKAKITQPTGKNGTLVVKSGHTGAISGQGVGNGTRTGTTGTGYTSQGPSGGTDNSAMSGAVPSTNLVSMFQPTEKNDEDREERR